MFLAKPEVVTEVLATFDYFIAEQRTFTINGRVLRLLLNNRANNEQTKA
jgi:hypothetical protein